MIKCEGVGKWISALHSDRQTQPLHDEDNQCQVPGYLDDNLPWNINPYLKVSFMERIQFITHNGKKILIEDFTNFKAGPEMIAQIHKAQTVIAGQPPKSVLALFDATGSSFNNDVLNAMKEFTKANTPYIKAACVVGINGLLQIALASIAKFSGRDFVTFKTRAEAMNWLASR